MRRHLSRYDWPFAALGATVVLLSLAQGVHAVSYPFFDDVETPGPWVADPGWATTTSAFHSPNTSWRVFNLPQSSSTSLTLASSIDLIAAVDPSSSSGTALARRRTSISAPSPSMGLRSKRTQGRAMGLSKSSFSWPPGRHTW